MAQDTTVDKAVVDAIVAEVTGVLQNGGSANITIKLNGFTATVTAEATVAPDVPVLQTVKTP